MTSELISYSSDDKGSYSRRLYGKSLDKSYHKNNHPNSFNGSKNDDFSKNNEKIIENKYKNNQNNNQIIQNNVLMNDGGMNELKRNRIAIRKKRRKKKKKTPCYSLIRGWCGFKDLNLSSALPFSIAVSQNGNRMIKRINGKGRNSRMRKRAIFKKVSLKLLLHKSKKTAQNSNDDIQKKRKMLISSYCCDITFNHFAFYYSPLSFTLFSFSPPQSKQASSHFFNFSFQFNPFHCSALAA